MCTSQPKPPNAFVSYSWDDEAHKTWVRDLSTRLLGNGVNVTLDRWATAPGDQLPQFMESAVRENDYVLIVCTPNYKEKSDKRLGGVGYEGDIMTGEVFTTRNRRKFIPILRRGSSRQAVPSWLSGTYYIDLRSDPSSEMHYQDLLVTLHGAREQAPPLGPKPSLTPRPPGTATPSSAQPAQSRPDEPIRITRVVADEVGIPKNDGTRGSALYAVPFQLSRRPSDDWSRLFIEQWKHPPEWTTMHRPSIARVEGGKVILDGTTIDEVEKYHRKTLKLAIDETNRIIAECEEKQRRQAEQRAEELKRHEDSVRDTAKRISFD
jgi:hypothetical protein